jgi:transcriptional regulator with XRE-family HTH domain
VDPTPAARPSLPEIDEEALRQIEDDILAAAELAAPLTSDQQERVRLDTIIRKGELDTGYAMLFRQLRLPPQQLDTLKTLLVERNQAIYDARQLAKEEGVTIATLSEENEVLQAATAEIDHRIASALGAGVAASLREYEDLQFFLGVAGIARTNQRTYNDPVDDEPVLTLARRLRDASPDLPELVFQAQGWDVETPQAAIDTVASVLGQEAAVRFAGQSRARTVRTQLAAIARDAILAGKLSTSALSKGIAREYDAALARQKEPVAP